MIHYAHTYSILGYDAEAGLMGGAVQSHYFSVGSGVLWAEAGAGIVATQALVNFDIGRTGVRLLGLGYEPERAMNTLLTADEGRELRQTAFMDASGRFSAHTGSKCIREAGHALGDGCSTHANMMKKTTVPKAMKEAFQRSAGPKLEDRLMAALDAAEFEGGDIRGMQSAAMVIVSIHKTGRPEKDRPLDLRVEDHTAPLEELRRLLALRRAYDYMDRADGAITRGDVNEAGRLYALAEESAGGNPEMKYWHGLTLADLGHTAEARAILLPLFRKNPDWLELTRRMPETGLVGLKAIDIDNLLKE